jgi:hypothetical protein
MERFVVLGVDDVAEALTLQRAAYVAEAQAHGDLDLPPPWQSLAALAAELGDPEVFVAGWRTAGAPCSVFSVAA